MTSGDRLQIPKEPSSEERRHADIESAPPSAVGEAVRSGGSELDQPTRRRMEHDLGHDFSQVRVHTDAAADAAARCVQADAYTVGHDVVFRSGRYPPHESQGWRLLRHELVHVAQNRAGEGAPQRVSVQAADDHLEQEARRLTLGGPHDAPAAVRVPGPHRSTGDAGLALARAVAGSVATSTPQPVIPAVSGGAEFERLVTLLEGPAPEQVRQLREVVTHLNQLRTSIVTPPSDPAEQRRWSQTTAAGRRSGQFSEERYAALHEAPPDVRSQMVELNQRARAIMDSLSAAQSGLAASDFQKIKLSLENYLNELTPYYTQLENRPVLSHGWVAAERTCNVTSLSMVLEALGLTPRDFSGDTAFLVHIANKLSARPQTYDQLVALRMPDFLQFVAVYVEASKSPARLPADFRSRTQFTEPEVDVTLARRRAAQRITGTLDVFDEIGRLFGAERVKVDAIRSRGSEEKRLKEQISTIEERQARARTSPTAPPPVRSASRSARLLGEELSPPAAIAQQPASRSAPESFVEYLSEGASEQPLSLLPVDNPEYQKAWREYAALPGKWAGKETQYKADVLARIGPSLAQGYQVVVHRYQPSGHYLRVAGLTDQGIRFFDPYTGGRLFTVPWAQANREGYFDSYQIFRRK